MTVWKPSAQKPAPTGWIWCQLAQATSEKTDSGKPAEDSLERDSEFEREGQELVEALLARCTEIKVRTGKHRACTQVRLLTLPAAFHLSPGNRSNSCKERREISKSSCACISSDVPQTTLQLTYLTVRDEEYASFGDKVKHLAQKYNVLSGKWLLFADGEGQRVEFGDNSR